MSNSVTVREVGPRDGLQMVTQILATAKKIEWARRCVDAGFKEIELTSFVPAKVLPQFADASEVVKGISGITYLKGSALVPNLKGAERAFSSGARHIQFVLSASETHNLKNVRRSLGESLNDLKRIVALRREMGAQGYSVGCGISTAFGCTMEGRISQDKVMGIVSQLVDLGIEEITIADTVGYANPVQVKQLMTQVLEVVRVPVYCHFHDTRGTGLANVAAAIDVGVRGFDSSLGGLGGCPFAPNATGNINTEDCVYLLESMGFDTGIDLHALLNLRQDLESWLPGEAFTGALERAGVPLNYKHAS